MKDELTFKKTTFEYLKYNAYFYFQLIVVFKTQKQIRIIEKYCKIPR